MSMSVPQAFDVQGRQHISQLWFLAQDIKLILLKMNFVVLKQFTSKSVKSPQAHHLYLILKLQQLWFASILITVRVFSLHADALGFNAIQYINCVTGPDRRYLTVIDFKSTWFQRHISALKDFYVSIFLGPSQSHILQQRWKAIPIKHPGTALFWVITKRVMVTNYHYLS